MERSGEVISREELRQKLWLADTFVDFDHSLNTIIDKLREVLGETTPSARFSEILAKRGSRFLPAVELVVTNDGDRGTTLSAKQTATGWPVKTRQASTSVLTRPEALPPVSQEYVRVLFLLIQLMYLSFSIMALARLSKVEEILAEVVARLRVSCRRLNCDCSHRHSCLLSAISFGIRGLRAKFSKLSGAPELDELSVLSPFLLSPQIGPGLALGIIAALTYVPIAQRTLQLMRESQPLAAFGASLQLRRRPQITVCGGKSWPSARAVFSSPRFGDDKAGQIADCQQNTNLGCQVANHPHKPSHSRDGSPM